MDLFNKSEIIVMASVLGSILLIIIALTILDFIDERREKKRNKEKGKIDSKPNKSIVEEQINNTIMEVHDEKNAINEMNNEISNEIEDIEVLDFNEPIIEMKEEITNNEVLYYDSLIIDDNIEIRYDEIMPIMENSNIQVIEETDNTNLSCKVIEMIKEELKNDVTDYENTITNFELEQEENAIISYDELIKVSDRLYIQNENYQYDDGNEPITIDEVIKRFGDSEMTFENTANYDKLNKEVDNHNADCKLIELFKQE